MSFSLLLLYSLITLAVSSPTPKSNTPQQQSPSQDSPQIVSPFDPKSNSGYTINPSWTPSSSPFVPLSLDAISPWNDAGRAQMVDNWVPGPWVNCPAMQELLNCKRCPRNFRCKLETETEEWHGTSTAQPTRDFGSGGGLQGDVVGTDGDAAEKKSATTLIQVPVPVLKVPVIKTHRPVSVDQSTEPTLVALNDVPTITGGAGVGTSSVSPQSTGGWVLPTRGVEHDDTTLPIMLPGMGSIHVPNMPVDGPGDVSVRPQPRPEEGAGYVSGVADLENVKEDF